MKTITKAAFADSTLGKKYNPDAQDYIASFADTMDMRVRNWWLYAKHWILNRGVLPKLKTDPAAYEKLEGYELGRG